MKKTILISLLVIFIISPSYADDVFSFPCTADNSDANLKVVVNTVKKKVSVVAVGYEANDVLTLDYKSTYNNGLGKLTFLKTDQSIGNNVPIENFAKGLYGPCFIITDKMLIFIKDNGRLVALKPIDGKKHMHELANLQLTIYGVGKSTSTNNSSISKGEESSVSRYASTTGNENGHKWVDLGLSVCWATTNVGANSEGGYGNYYAYGETVSKKNYKEQNYKHSKGDFFTKYCSDSSYGNVDNKTSLEPIDDVAAVKWGGKWRIPTKEECEELCNRCTWKSVVRNGHKGCLVTGPNGNSIFLPAAGIRSDYGVHEVGITGLYRSSTTKDSGESASDILFFYTTSSHFVSLYARFAGHSVRPVIKP